MPKRNLNRRSDKAHAAADAVSVPQSPLRIVGGTLRGRRLMYSGDPRTRPMKERVRESVFNLVGPAVKGKHAIDLFAGTGALGLEALSRGAAKATFIEQHFPTAAIIRQNIEQLGLGDVADVQPANTFIWARRAVATPDPWLVFCSPPFDFYVERAAEMQAMLERLCSLAKPESIFVVEADHRFDFSMLPHADDWDVREYPPAVVGIYHPPVDDGA